jgi:GH18 family chitinase
MAASQANREKFIASSMRYIRKYGLDGIDLDWEYPAASDRGGSKEDTANYVTLLKEMRTAFDEVNSGWEITVTLPTSYWYVSYLLSSSSLLTKPGISDTLT